MADLNGHSADDTGQSCPFWLDLHPFLAHYQSADTTGGCTPTGSTGASSAPTGFQRRLGALDGRSLPVGRQSIELSLTMISDDVVAYPGVYVDDISGPGSQGTTPFENDGDPLDGWVASGPPEGSPASTGAW
ncbi:MAG TPA: hypothetical protein VFP34_03870 [Microlunatus sp.]|nr:hypothetical protein [Microlunatus sp.]